MRGNFFEKKLPPRPLKKLKTTFFLSVSANIAHSRKFLQCVSTNLIGNDVLGIQMLKRTNKKPRPLGEVAATADGEG